MTPTQVFLVAVIGGLSVPAALLAIVGGFLAVHAGVSRLIDRCEARRESHRARQADADLSTCRAIHALDTHSDQN